MFGKMGMSLNRAGWEVTLIGSACELPEHAPAAMRFIQLPRVGRLSFGRLLAPWRVLIHTLKVQPTVFIFNTHELLLPALLVKILCNAAVVYDVRENYYRNILHTNVYHWLLRGPLAFWIRFKEKVLAPAIDHFFLAEAGYDHEFRFHRGGWTVLENKPAFTTPVPSRQHAGVIKLLFSGTLAESTGVFAAIRFAKELHKLDPGISLVIAGHAHQPEVRKRIQEEVKGAFYIRLIGGDAPLPHATIMQEILAADFGILSYPRSKHIVNSRPTKLFEYLATGLPIILEGWWPWVQEFAVHDAFIKTDFRAVPSPGIIQQLRFRRNNLIPVAGMTWETEEGKFLQAIERLYQGQ